MIDLMTELNMSYPEAVVGVPYYPTQNKEKFYGSDVIATIDSPDFEQNHPFITLFMQFKRSDKLTTGRANYWGDFGGPYYRFDIHNKNQHNTIVSLDENLGSAGYVAPGFHTNEERLHYVDNKELLDNSLFLQSDQKALSDDHKICFTVRPLDATMYSEPSDIDEVSQLGTTLEFILERGSEFETFEEQRDAFRKYRYELIDEMSHIPEREYPNEEQYENRTEWIYEQQRFYLKYLNIHPQFLLQDGGHIYQITFDRL